MSKRPKIDSWYDYVIRGTGTAADNDEFIKARTVMNARGKGRIVLDGDVMITTGHDFTAPIGLTCLPGGCLVQSGGSAYVAYGSWTHPYDRTTYSISSLAEKAPTVVCTQALAEGDYVALMADNAMTTVTPHNPDTKYYPLELHRISRAQVGASNTYLLGDYVDDVMNRNQRLAILTDMIKGLRIDGLRVKHDYGTDHGGTFLRIGFCADFELNDVTFQYPNMGQLGINYCHGGRLSGIRIEDAEDANAVLGGSTGSPAVYGIVLLNSNGLIISHCDIAAVRHPVTTGSANWTRPWVAGETLIVGDYRWSGGRGYECTVAGTTSAVAPNHVDGSVRSTSTGGAAYGVTWDDLGTVGGYSLYGNVKNTAIRNNNIRGTAYQNPPGSAFSGMTLIDTHPAGRRITVEGNTITVPGEAQNYGIGVRSRDMIIKGNTIHCGNGCVPVNVVGTNCVIDGNTFDGGFTCYIAPGAYGGGTVDNCTFNNNTFRKMFGPGVHVSTGTGHVISNNTFHDCGYLFASNLLSRGCIHIAALTNTSSTVRIDGNTMNKVSNLFSVTWADTILASQIKIGADNRCEGYGDFSIGLRVPLLRIGEVVQHNEERYSAGHIYRVSGGHTVSVVPVHTSGTVGNWVYVRAYSGSKCAELESRHAFKNGQQKWCVMHVQTHGRTILDQYKVLNTAMNGLWDDADVGSTTDGHILLDVIDENYLIVAKPGHVMEIPAAMILGSYTISGDGRELYWDLSDTGGGYKASPTGSSDVRLLVHSYQSTYVQVEVQ